MNAQKRKTILLVEDEILIGLAEADTIRRFGYDVITAGSGEEAVRVATSGVIPDLVLMDIELGKGIDGTEAASRILRSHPVPIVFLTSHSEREMVEMVRGITRYGYVIKNSGDFVLQSSIEMAFELFETNERLKDELTDRKLAEARAQESAQRFRSYFELPLIGIAITSPTGGWLEVNDQLCSDLGYSREQLVRMTWVELTHSEDLDADMANFRRVLAGEMDGYAMEKRFICADGRVMPSELAVRCVRKADGNVDYFVALVQDITARKTAEEEIRIRKQELELAMHSSGAGMWNWDMVLGKLDWSTELYALFGLDPERDEASFDNWRRVLHPEDRQQAADRMAQAIADRLRLVNDYRIVQPDGRLRWIKALGDTTYDDLGKPIRMTGICIDITERRRWEAEYRTIL